MRLRFKDIMTPQRHNQPKVKVATRSERVNSPLVVLIGLVVTLLIGVSIGL